jgi:hypothetical protein
LRAHQTQHRARGGVRLTRAILEVLLEALYRRLLGEDIDENLEGDHHHQEENDGLGGQADADAPQALNACRSRPGDACPDPGPGESRHHALIL